VVRDQAFALRDLLVGSVVDDVALVGRVVRQFREERIEIASNFVMRLLTELVYQNRLRVRANRCRL